MKRLFFVSALLYFLFNVNAQTISEPFSANASVEYKVKKLIYSDESSAIYLASGKQNNLGVKPLYLKRVSGNKTLVKKVRSPKTVSTKNPYGLFQFSEFSGEVYGFFKGEDKKSGDVGFYAAKYNKETLDFEGEVKRIVSTKYKKQNKLFFSYKLSPDGKSLAICQTQFEDGFSKSFYTVNSSLNVMKIPLNKSGKHDESFTVSYSLGTTNVLESEKSINDTWGVRHPDLKSTSGEFHITNNQKLLKIQEPKVGGREFHLKLLDENGVFKTLKLNTKGKPLARCFTQVLGLKNKLAVKAEVISSNERIVGAYFCIVDLKTLKIETEYYGSYSGFESEYKTTVGENNKSLVTRTITYCVLPFSDGSYSIVDFKIKTSSYSTSEGYVGYKKSVLAVFVSKLSSDGKLVYRKKLDIDSEFVPCVKGTSINVLFAEKVKDEKGKKAFLLKSYVVDEKGRITKKEKELTKKSEMKEVHSFGSTLINVDNAVVLFTKNIGINFKAKYTKISLD